MNDQLTDLQQEALNMAKDRPGLTVEDYANMMGNTSEVYNAFARLIFQQYLRVDEVTGAVTTRGIS